MTQEQTDEGRYYTLGSQPHAGQIEPVQPKYIDDISTSSVLTKVHGIVFTSGIYTDILAFDPIIERAITEPVQMVEPTFYAPGWNPAFPYRINTIRGNTSLVAVLGQYNSEQQTERLYDHLSFDIYYHTDATDWIPPTIGMMNSTFASGSVSVTVTARDLSGIHAVVIAYTEGTGYWHSIALENNGITWSGSYTGTLATHFLVQAVDGVGNVKVYDKQGMYYQPGDGFATYMIYLPIVTK